MLTGYLEKGIQTPMAQGRSTETISMIKWIRTSRLSIKNSLSLQERGISISSTALQFEYNGIQINLLDTPGHEDFSEDTYRTIAVHSPSPPPLPTPPPP